MKSSYMVEIEIYDDISSTALTRRFDNAFNGIDCMYSLTDDSDESDIPDIKLYLVCIETYDGVLGDDIQRCVNMALNGIRSRFDITENVDDVER